ncbi:MAG TPA: anthranilate phosphoribosyltransferase, partial [Candidatus Omnitrophica bacterium]|nr:anthranilate phosphoribosyltransferase [Candidatus Omnitrophota bacterium]
IKEAIQRLIEGIDLTEEQMQGVFEQIMSGKATDAQIGAFLTALRLKSETVEEITGAAKIMRKKATKLEGINISQEIILDTCGTGGSGTNTFNISTTCAFVVAGCGVKVAKHGNKSISSQCGSADVLNELGINLDLPPEKVAECIKRIGIGFLYAPLFHSAMKHVLGPRRELGIRTIFNVLGPLTNPANANTQVLGVYEEKLVEVIANVLKNLGSRFAFVVYGLDGLDEITITGPTKISELRNNEVNTYYIKPQDFDIPPAQLEDIKGGDVKENAKIIIEVLSGKKGPKRDVVLLNSAAALVAADKARDFKEGIKLASDSIDSKRALRKLEELKEITHQL